MAKVTISNIDEIFINTFPEERTINTTGIHALHQDVSQIYVDKGYADRPKSSDEAKERGISGFNGLQTSIARLDVDSSHGKNVVEIDLLPTRYLVGKAMEELAEERKMSFEEMVNYTPRMANVSLLCPVIDTDGSVCLIGQIKGAAKGSGQIHGALVAGGVSYEAFQTDNPFVSALNSEAAEELGINLDDVDYTSFIAMLDEREIGMANFISIAPGIRLDDALNSYENSIRNKFSSEELEVGGIAKLSVGGLAIVPLNGKPGVQSVECYLPTSSGLQRVVEDRNVRPYTEAIINYFSQPGVVEQIYKRAGL